ncbi:MAG: rhodanese-like domain-containing protein [Propionibacteriaceae bacterium]|jgi:rhodanese-related sulfurtransferase|nr:rhodanese-like domain-containing protein [Propionibacteriaceae bacterium]
MSRIILDVRTPEEYAARHVDGAINLNFHDPDFARRISEFPKDVEYVVYCNAGGRASRAATRMKTLGFTDVTAYGIMGASVATGATVTYRREP